MTNTTPSIATHKIIFFVVFICAALMTSLFVYHASQKTARTALPPEAGTLFQVPRDIKPFTFTESGQKTFSNKGFYQHWTLLFFGFTHCQSICPTTLDSLKAVYSPLKKQFPALQVVLVSVDPLRDTGDTVMHYAQGYHPDFIGLTGKLQDVRKLQSQLGIYAERDNTNTSNYQIQHTSSILLINPQGKWAGTFRFGLPADTLKQAIATGINTHG